MNFILIDNTTGAQHERAFTPDDFHRIVVDPLVSAVPGWQPSHDQATRQIDIWNRAQIAHRQEFSYRLA